MSSREEAARAFAKAMGGWEFFAASTAEARGWFDRPHPTIKSADTFAFDFPNADAPLHEHLAFVGRVAMALGKPWRLTFGDYTGAALPFQVGFSRADDENHIAWASDPSWAALLAALEAKGVSR